MYVNETFNKYIFYRLCQDGPTYASLESRMVSPIGPKSQQTPLGIISEG
jgi:hypothetical protein